MEPSDIEIIPGLLNHLRTHAQNFASWGDDFHSHNNPIRGLDKINFERSATPQVVLALIREIERLQKIMIDDH